MMPRFFSFPLTVSPLATIPWVQAHGALVHFPIALTIFALACDATALVYWRRPSAPALHRASSWALGLSALGAIGASISGLVLTRGELLGHDALRWHHLFAWPALALIVGLATWRQLAPMPASARGRLLQVLVQLALVGTVSAAGHWGGQLALAAS